MMVVLQLLSLKVERMEKKIYCLGRKQWVAATPEELIRQELLHNLTLKLKFPAGGIVLEKALSDMPHLSLEATKIPTRRADIVCYARGIHPKHDLYPLLLIECKAVKLTPRSVNQVVGYNHFIKAHFIALANGEEVKCGFYDKSENQYRFISYIPTYEELLSSIIIPK